MTPAGTPPTQQTVRGRGGRQRAAAVAGSRGHQLPSRQTDDRFRTVPDTVMGGASDGCEVSTSTLHRHSSRLETTSENSGLSCGGNFRLMPTFMFCTRDTLLSEQLILVLPAHDVKVNSSDAAPQIFSPHHKRTNTSTLADLFNYTSHCRQTGGVTLCLCPDTKGKQTALFLKKAFISVF